MPAAGPARPGGLTAGSQAGAARRSGSGARLRAPCRQPGGRVPGPVSLQATWGSGPATVRRVRVFSWQVLSTSQGSAEHRISPPAIAPEAQEQRHGRGSAAGGEVGRRRRTARGGREGAGVGDSRDAQPRPRPLLSYPSEPAEQGEYGANAAALAP